MFVSCLVFLLTILVSSIHPNKALEFEFMKLESETSPDKIIDRSKLKVSRVRRGVYGITGEVELLQTLDEKSEISVRGFYSLNGANEYKLLPYHISPKSFCAFLNEEYKKYLTDLPKFSDLPVVGEEYYCPLKKAVYHVNNYEWDPSKLPVPFQPGIYKIQVTIKSSSGDKSIYNAYIKVLGL